MSDDEQVAAMLADPEGYFRRIRQEARDEAELYVARRAVERRRKRQQKASGSFYLRMPFERGDLILTASTPLAAVEYDALLAAVTQLREGLVGRPVTEECEQP